MLLLCLMGLFLFQETQSGTADQPYYVVLKNKKRIVAVEPPVFEGKLCYVVLPNGNRTSLPLSMVDQQETIEYNQRMVMKREAELMEQRRLAREEAEKAAQEPPEEKKEPKRIVLTSTEDLPSYADAGGTVTGSADTETSDNPVRGEPKVRTFSGSEGVILQKETVYELEQGYRIVCEVKVQEPTGAQNVNLAVEINFDGAPKESYSKAVTPTTLPYDSVAEVVFTTDTRAEIIRTRYNITGDVLAVVDK